MVKSKHSKDESKSKRTKSPNSESSSRPPKGMSTTSAKSSASAKPKKQKTPKLEELALISEPLKSAGPGRPLCERCGLCSKNGSDPVTPWIPDGWTGKLLLVGPPPDDDG